jgi:hypothetical protein
MHRDASLMTSQEKLPIKLKAKLSKKNNEVHNINFKQSFSTKVSLSPLTERAKRLRDKVTNGKIPTKKAV